jgi:hypothetical protein
VRSPQLGLVSLAAVTGAGSHVPLDGHLWHVIEALGFLVVTLGGIWVSEVVKRRRRAGSDRAGDLYLRMTNKATTTDADLGTFGAVGPSAPSTMRSQSSLFGREP